MIAELEKWLAEQEAALAEEAGARPGSTLAAYSTGFGDAVRRLREWFEAHARATWGSPVPCRCGGVVAGAIETRPAPHVELVTKVCRCGRPVSVKIKEARVPDGVHQCDGCGDMVEAIAGVIIAHPPKAPKGVRARRKWCPGSGRPPR